MHTWSGSNGSSSDRSERQKRIPFVLFRTKPYKIQDRHTRIHTDINIMQRKTETIYNVSLAAFSATYFNILIRGVHSWRACRTHYQ